MTEYSNQKESEEEIPQPPRIPLLCLDVNLGHGLAP